MEGAGVPRRTKGSGFCCEVERKDVSEEQNE
jgi:hypothetical protein